MYNCEVWLSKWFSILTKLMYPTRVEVQIVNESHDVSLLYYIYKHLCAHSHSLRANRKTSTQRERERIKNNQKTRKERGV